MVWWIVIVWMPFDGKHWLALLNLLFTSKALSFLDGGNGLIPLIGESNEENEISELCTFGVLHTQWSQGLLTAGNKQSRCNGPNLQLLLVTSDYFNCKLNKLDAAFQLNILCICVYVYLYIAGWNDDMASNLTP